MAIRIFGKLNDIVNKPFAVDYPVSLGTFKTILHQHFPELRSISFQIAIDQQMNENETLLLTEDSEIALLPPFSGG
ncbi:MoaD/ThiS family protein [Flavobacterium sp. WV_118_3]|uniref:MoaD/ThiS family protein n=1 Tax=Flavobacterium sp. WV_118_3 TaxID=3151764 RepID=UPI00321AC490